MTALAPHGDPAHDVPLTMGEIEALMHAAQLGWRAGAPRPTDLLLFRALGKLARLIIEERDRKEHANRTHTYGDGSYFIEGSEQPK